MTTSFRNIRRYAKYCELEIRNGWKLRKVWGKKKQHVERLDDLCHYTKLQF